MLHFGVESLIVDLFGVINRDFIVFADEFVRGRAGMLGGWFTMRSDAAFSGEPIEHRQRL